MVEYWDLYNTLFRRLQEKMILGTHSSLEKILV